MPTKMNNNEQKEAPNQYKKQYGPRKRGSRDLSEPEIVSQDLSSEPEISSKKRKTSVVTSKPKDTNPNIKERNLSDLQPSEIEQYLAELKSNEKKLHST